jgi:RNA polymerase sigma-70 factor (ECF subfamily)
MSPAPPVEAGADTSSNRGRVASPERARIHAWMTALASGDRTAFEPLYRALWPIVSRVCARMLPNPADADDAAQDALVRLAGRVSEFDPARDAVAWVIGITIFECRTVRKRVARRREDAFEASVASGANHADDPESAAMAAELQQALRDVLEQLAPGDVAVIEAALRDERSVEGDVSAATFRKRLQRAMARLRTAWRSSHGDE